MPMPLPQSSLEISVENGGVGNGAAAVVRETSLRRTDQGIVLAWEDLWVSAAGSKGGRIPILCGLNGYAHPGEVLAIMGPSGCGKSTLLDALAGRLSSNVSQKGDILINVRRQKLAFGTSAYVTQDDVLMTTLTVREVVHYSAQLQLPSAMSAAAKRERAEETLREMGLEGAADTRISGWAHKGISGGQRRRVSICMEILTRPALLFLDEPTSGLHSAASYHVIGRIARLARHEGMTVVTAVHQPSTEVFGLFHGLCLLAYGKTVFVGAAVETSQFFALSGFPCPSLMNPSDHFLRTINKDFDKDIEEGLDGKTLTTAQAIDALVNSYKSSVHLEKVTRQIADIRDTGGAVGKKEGQPSFLTQSVVLTKRSFVNMYRDLGYYWLRFAIYVALHVPLHRHHLLQCRPQLRIDPGSWLQAYVRRSLPHLHGPHIPQQPGRRRRHDHRRRDPEGLLAGGDGVQQVGRPHDPVRDGGAIQGAIRNLNTMIGRAAHVEFLEDVTYARFIMWSFPEFFR